MRAIAIVAALTFAGCTSSFECLGDSECRDGELCNAGTCEPGQRGTGNPGGDSGSSGGDAAIEDNQPPIVVIVSPTPYQLVSGAILIEASIVDNIAVDAENVTAVIADAFEIPLLPIDGGNRFIGAFDVGILGDAAFPSLVVVAYDLARNKGRSGIEFALDTTPPAISFTSPQQQFSRLGDDSGFIECSSLTNPLGLYNVVHGATIDPGWTNGLSFYVRLRIEDRGNGGFPGVAEPVAGVDQSTPKLFLLDSTGINAGHKLLITDGAGGCRINPLVIPNPEAPRTDQAIVQRLVPIPPLGYPLFNGTGPVTLPCERLGVDEEFPSSVCGHAEPGLTLWTGYIEALDSNFQELAPSVWTLNEYDAENVLVCSGGAFDAANFSDNGEVCLAVSAADRLGFSGVSRPIAICVDRNNSGACIGFDATVNAASMCSDGCVTSAYPPDFGTQIELISLDGGPDN